MPDPRPPRETVSLSADEAYRPDETQIAEAMFADHYGTLMAIARSRRRDARLGDTMQTSDVLQETYIRLSGGVGWSSHNHFLRTAILAIRQVIVDHARRRLSAKRGGGSRGEPIDAHADTLAEWGETPEEIVAIGDLLRRLELENPRWMRVVDARYFAGLSEAEAAAVLGLSERSVRRDWRAARDWLAGALGR